MEQVKAPEKIYLEKVYPDNGVLPNGLNYNQSPNDIEYTRTDAFIEKAAQWLKENLLNHTYVYEGEVGIGMAVFLEDFKKAMKLWYT